MNPARVATVLRTLAVDSGDDETPPCWCKTYHGGDGHSVPCMRARRLLWDAEHAYMGPESEGTYDTDRDFRELYFLAHDAEDERDELWSAVQELRSHVGLPPLPGWDEEGDD